MKIAFFSPAWPYGSNGIISYVRHLSLALHQMGHSVTILTFSATESLGYEHLIQIPVIPKPNLVKRLLQKLIWPQKPNTTHQLAAELITQALLKLHRNRGVDIFEIEETFGWANDIAKQVPFPVVVRLHGPYAYYGQYDASFDEKRAEQEGAAIRQASALSSPSTAILESTRAFYNLGEKGVMIPNPIPLPPMNLCWSDGNHTPKSLLFVGRTDAHKGGDLVLRMFNQLIESNPDAHLHFVGPDKGFIDAPESVSWQDYLNTHLSAKAQANIIYHGLLAPDAIAQLRRQCAITLIFSRYENFPLTCLEAAAYGCPIVASNTGGIPEIIEHGQTGLLVDVNQPKDLIEKVETLLNNPQLAAQLGAAARQFCEIHFSPEVVGQQTLDFFKTTVTAFPRNI